MKSILSSWWHRKRVQAEVQFSHRPVEVHRVTNPYHAVSIKAGPSCRRTARQYSERRFLAQQAPPIPLPTCDAGNCRCRYLHHEDRRDGDDRRHRNLWNESARLMSGEDRRGSHGRRVTDH